ncbi:MAG: hypothetical protein KTR28_06010 [Micavibrio sp.]|nr:hypothetical protein [Micavibrio sp.]
MIIDVFLDNNVWNFLFANNIDLSNELPSDEFKICITREVEFETQAIPDKKAELRKYIKNAIKNVT